MSNGDERTGNKGAPGTDESNFEELDSDNISTNHNQGFFGRGAKRDGVPPYPRTGHEKIIYPEHALKHNCWVVLGRDRWGTSSMGKGMQGETGCGSIDIVVGRMGFDPSPSTRAHPMFAGGDAARIYISQRADVDRYFKIREAGGNTGFPASFFASISALFGAAGEGPSDDEYARATGNSIIRSEDRSCVGISADAIRIIGQEGVKILTKAGTKNNSLGQEITGIPGIHLCAGDDQDGLQPMILGGNMVKLVGEMIDLHANTLKVIRDMNIIIRDICIASVQHQHSVLAWGSGASISINTAATDFLDSMKDSFSDGTKEANAIQKRLDGLKSVYLRFAGTHHIMSQYNRVN